MKKALKIVTLLICAVLLVALGVAGTIAYFTWNDSVKNTFTVGKVTAKLDETKVDEYGVPVQGADRVTDGNTFKIIPGHTYVKDPTLTIGANSEDAYLFVKLEDDLLNAESMEAGISIYDQLVTNGWTKYSESGNVSYYMCEHNKTSADKVYKTFETLKIDESVGNDVEGGTLKVTAYVIQKEGLTAQQAFTEATKQN